MSSSKKKIGNFLAKVKPDQKYLKPFSFAPLNFWADHINFLQL